MRRVFQILLAFAATVLLCGAALAQDRVVYHIDDAAAQATKGLRNIRNHLDVAPDTKITVVTHANGVDFLMEGAKDAKDANIDYGSLVSALKARGVAFEICEITLRNRNLKKEQFTMDATFTHAGSRTALLGTNPSAALVTLMSNEKQVTANTPPAFLVHTTNDGTVPVKNSQVFSDSCQKKGVPHKLLIYPAGNHGFGLADGKDGAPNYTTPPNDIIHWPDSAKAWLQGLGMLTATTTILPQSHSNFLTPMNASLKNQDALDLLGRESELPHGRALKVLPVETNPKQH